ncbi:membrane associated lipoprotein [[Clostridium] sordellii]|uniref:DUF4300 family protein n=1 Tax=Paraclostridium sordellii TaxID=1505 RepID=UPI0005E27D85|nr:DUF4300 family protein [Paeniclostridium sordellii]CEP41011.1 membrane associated lipoprotein [[Clostridium] sordellii] [Paeniclostridium sordellii]
MKKIYIISCLLIMFLLTCITYIHLTSIQYKVTFNYFNNKQVVNHTKTVLLNNKVQKDNINLWMECVKGFNSKNKNSIQCTSKGWHTLNLNDYNKIDFTKNLNKWTEEDDYLDLNCRISSFILVSDMISSDCFTKKYDSSIEKEITQMSNIFKRKLTNEEITTFRSLFTPITFNINTLKDINIYDESLKNLKNSWKKENLIFKNNNLSLIQVVFIEPTNTTTISVFTGHTGILIKNDNDICFIEKKNPCFPYQISKFQNYNDLNQYIISQFKYTKNRKLMILQNDNIIFRK